MNLYRAINSLNMLKEKLKILFCVLTSFVFLFSYSMSVFAETENIDKPETAVPFEIKNDVVNDLMNKISKSLPMDEIKNLAASAAPFFEDSIKKADQWFQAYAPEVKDEFNREIKELPKQIFDTFVSTWKWASNWTKS